jgi:hypothetical protein
LYFRPMSGYDVTTMKSGGERVPYNQDGILEILGWKGNLTMSNAQLQGVLRP